MMEAASTSETSVNFYQATRHSNPEDSQLHTRTVRTWNLTACSVFPFLAWRPTASFSTQWLVTLVGWDPFPPSLRYRHGDRPSVVGRDPQHRCNSLKSRERLLEERGWSRHNWQWEDKPGGWESWSETRVGVGWTDVEYVLFGKQAHCKELQQLVTHSGQTESHPPFKS
jgi:hypothetical protein